MSARVPTRADGAARPARTDPPSPGSRPPFRSRFRFRIAGADLSASVTVFLIALPLSLGIALATGAPLQGGLVAAAVGGLVVGRLGGAPLQVSGPAAGLTVVTADLIQLYGWRTTCAITVCAGLAQLGLSALRVARSALAVSPAIVHGMLAGIGVTIALSQLHIVLGGSPQSSAVANVKGLPAQLADLHPGAVSVSAFTIVVLLAWPRIPGRGGRFVRKVPATLAAVALATSVAAVLGVGLPRVDLPSWSNHALPELPQGPVLGLIAAVLTVTLVGSVESLLSAVAVDKLVSMRKEPAVRIPRARLDRELFGQGSGNILSGALGGLPITGVAVRSSANVAAGAVSRNSTMLHGLWVAVAALLLVPVLDLIPLAALAALVMVVGIQMVNLVHLRSVKRNREMLVYAVTLAGVVFTGVLEGVAIGIAVAVAVAMHRLTRTRITVAERNGVHRIRVRGQLTFLAVPRLSRILQEVPHRADSVVELDGSFMDHAAYEALHDWQTSHLAQGGTAEFTGRAGGRIAEPTTELQSCCRPWTPWRNHHCGEHPAAEPAVAEVSGASPSGAVASHPVSFGTASSGTDLSGTDLSGTASSGTGPSDTAPSSTDPSSTDPSDTITPGPATAPGPGPDPAPSPTAPSAPPRNSTSDLGTSAAPRVTQPHLDGRRHPVGGGASSRQLASGISSFQRNTAPHVRDELARLAREGQRPSQLFLTCADSRLVTSMITSSGPGDLFTVRNVGNLVPLPGADGAHGTDDSVAAAIEYAVDVLRVQSITVCGHSGCGAMQALLNTPDVNGEPRTPLRRWLRHGQPSLDRMKSKHHSWARISGRLPADAIEQLCLTNVVQQLAHLRAHDAVARGLAEGRLELHGMYFHVGEAQAYLLADGSTTGSSGGGSEEVFNRVSPTALEESRA
ncbi:SulP family inorganic anion transporter [Streptomyces sp. SID3212]|uniref:bifunctional SulP family inorganic anion transporter/carbonic anhydrase n=1 Tax=Streptomyces sp. SID3212 TaxID=2690259 RepID=UPI0013709453|nr:SulP family inorganic anion transporter [Streptomyces sp. SID3212]MYV52370.1 transporter [Streptomyces sp. SID3212]